LALVITAPAAAQQLALRGALGEKVQGYYEHLVFSPDGKTLAAGWRGKIHIYDVAQGRLITEIAAYKWDEGNYLSLAYSPDGRTLASGINNPQGPKIKLWDTGDWKKQGEMGGGVRDLTFSSDGKFLAAVVGVRDVQLWNVKTGKKGALLSSKPPNPATRPAYAPSIQGGFRRTHQIAFSPDSQALVLVSPEGILSWDPDAAKGKRKLPTIAVQMNRPYCLAFSSDGKTLACGGAERNGAAKIELWDWEAQKAVTLFTEIPTPKNSGGIKQLFYTADGKSLLAGSYRRILLWDLATGKLAGALDDPVPDTRNSFSQVALSPDGAMLATAADQIRLWDLKKH
jgi:WD40 repeat protein